MYSTGLSIATDPLTMLFGHGPTRAMSAARATIPAIPAGACAGKVSSTVWVTMPVRSSTTSCSPDRESFRYGRTVPSGTGSTG